MRFIVLDKCLRNRTIHYFLDDSTGEGLPNLLDECNKALIYKGLSPVSRRTIFGDINKIEDIYQTDILREQEGKRKYYRYADPDFSIEHAPITDDEMHKLQETILMLGRFRTQFPWMEETLTQLQTKFHIDGHTESIIGFESNVDIMGIEHLEPLFQYILNKQVIIKWFISHSVWIKSLGFCIHIISNNIIIVGSYSLATMPMI